MDQKNLKLLHDVVVEWEAAGHGRKGAVLAKRLPLIKMSLATFHRQRRQFGNGKRRKPPAHKGERQQSEMVKWVRIIAGLKYSPHKGVSRLSTKTALAEAIRQEKIPLEAAEMNIYTINRIAREQGLTMAPRRGQRFEAPLPNAIHQVDATGSRHFFPKRTLGGEWILGLRPGQLPNKEKIEGLRVWCWGLVDDFSGFRVQRYFVAPGEAALDGVAFLRWAWEAIADHAPFQGLPHTLYMDNGPLSKYTPFRVFCEEVGVNLRTHEPYRPQATGKVETGWKDMKGEFEGRFLRGPGWRTREITLTELNQELAWFRQETNKTAHRRLPLTKEQAWLRIMLQGGPEPLTDESWERIFTQNIYRTLDDAGCFNLGGEAFQVVGAKVWACRVQVFQQVSGVQAGKPAPPVLIVEDLRDGQRYEAGPFVPKVAGDYCSSPKTPLERVWEEAEVQRSAGGTPAPTPTTWEPGTADNVVALVKPGEVRESRFEMPPASVPAAAPPTLEELAAGVILIQRSAGGDARTTGTPGATEPRLFATVHARYQFLQEQIVRGGELTPPDREFLAWYAAEYQDILALVDREQGPQRLAVVE